MKIEIFDTTKLQNLMIEHGLIEPAAIDDPENYDCGATTRRVSALWRAINDIISHTPEPK